MDKTINICHLYPEVLNLYGDRGNILCLKRRLEWIGLKCNITEHKLGDKSSMNSYDLFFVGGGQDFEQEVIISELRSGMGDEIRKSIEDGKTFLCICGGYQMLGHYYETKDKEKLEFLGAIDFHTVGGDVRMIDNYAFKCSENAGGSIIVGFENHSGLTYLEGDTKPLGQIVIGNGNNGKDKTEGARYKNVFGTYLHGSFLPKNPQFADYLLELALGENLIPLNNDIENSAHESLISKAY